MDGPADPEPDTTEQIEALASFDRRNLHYVRVTMPAEFGPASGPR